MADFSFEKGDDITIYINGQILGGVKGAVCRRDNTCYSISEFLNDIPVKKLSKSNYQLELVLDGSDILQTFQGQNIQSIEFAGSYRKVIYSDCFIDSVDTSINPEKPIEYTVKITAVERSEIDGEL